MLRSTLCSILLGMSALALADTTITYQGHLQDNDQPFDGQADMTFELFDDFDPDDPSVGSSLAGPISVTDINVTDGLFQVELDFGTTYDQPVWLEITVGSNTTLSPRQRVTPAPIAVHALGVAEGVSGLWRQNGDAIHYSASNQSISFTPASNTDNGLTTIVGHDVNDAVGSNGGTISGGGRVANGTPRPNRLEYASYAVISGGYGNTVTNFSGTIGGGNGNSADYQATIGGGAGNTALGEASTIGGGRDHQAKGNHTTVSGGNYNRAWDHNGAISGGRNNQTGNNDGDPTAAQYATVGGGFNNVANGAYATVPGGQDNQAGGDHSFAAGLNAQANHDGGFVWADSSGGTLSTTDADQFIVRANGGILFMSGSGSCALDPNHGDWNCNAVSDRHAKTDVESVSTGVMLDRVVELPVYTWRYENSPPDNRRVGPMAQDFHAAFDFASDNTTIRSHDLAAVTLAAIQGLHDQLQKERSRVTRLTERNRELEKRLSRIEAFLETEAQALQTSR